MDKICAGCPNKIPGRECLTCSICKGTYDLECAGVSSARYYNTMTKDHKNKWKCQSCICKRPKRGNLSTPVRKSDHSDSTQEEQNITLRRKNLKQPPENETVDSDIEDSSILGDTLPAPDEQLINHITLQQLSNIISEKLSENNTAIISQLKTTIQKEINKTMSQFKEDLKHEIDGLHIKNNQRKFEIENVNRKIEKLELETRKIQRELTEIKSTPETSKMFDDTSKKIYKQEDNTKKIVLYGIEEYKHEPEHELHIRLIEMFREKLHIDLLGYIEETRRIGKYNGETNRPKIDDRSNTTHYYPRTRTYN
ncbi:uncharacterized protein LOC135087342 [Ostrinia nubilalis]|uniref:uncharacterized protein LOC135087342 n=1 Tax=Ostrinia nubilalis TaxID=29057 RepID=UPI0030822DEC